MTRDPVGGGRPTSTPAGKWSVLWAFDGVVSLTRIGRFALLAVVTLALAATIVIDATTEWSSRSAIEICALLACACFAWRPSVAAGLLIILGPLAMLLGVGAQQSIALTVSYGLVVYTCSRSLVIAYSLVTASMFVAGLADGRVSAGGTVAMLAVAVGSGLIGAVSRIAVRRHRQVEVDLDRRAAEAEEAVQRERERIADELHSLVAHDVTVVAMHARALSLTHDPAVQSESVRAISAAATQAMTDIRRMLQVSTDGDVSSELEQPLGIHGLVEDARERLEGAHIPVEITLDPVDGGHTLSTNVATTLGHIAQESVNNVIVHAPRSRMARVAVTTTADDVTLSIWNDSPGDPAPERPRGGYGIQRLRERVRVLGGTFTAGPEADGWLVTATLPRT